MSNLSRRYSVDSDAYDPKLKVPLVPTKPAASRPAPAQIALCDERARAEISALCEKIGLLEGRVEALLDGFNALRGELLTANAANETPPSPANAANKSLPEAANGANGANADRKAYMRDLMRKRREAQRRQKEGK